MGINKDQLRELVEDVLLGVGLHSDDAVELLMGTAAQESALGTYIHQLGKGPALGIFQMEPNTLKDIYNNYLCYKHDLAKRISDYLKVDEADLDALGGDLRYQIVMARVHYLRVSEGIPGKNDIYGQAAYWKKYYNTPLGAGTEKEYKHNYEQYVA